MMVLVFSLVSDCLQLLIQMRYCVDSFDGRVKDPDNCSID